MKYKICKDALDEIKICKTRAEDSASDSMVLAGLDHGLGLGGQT